MGYSICFSSESSTHCQNRVRSWGLLYNTCVDIRLAIFLFMTNLQDRVFLYARMGWQINSSKPLKENIIRYSKYSYICDLPCLSYFLQNFYICGYGKPSNDLVFEKIYQNPKAVSTTAKYLLSLCIIVYSLKKSMQEK